MLKKARIYHCNDNEETDFKTNIEIDDKRIIYKEDDNTEVLYDIKNEQLLKENNHMYLDINFKKEIMNIYLKEEKKSIDLKLNLKKLEFKNNSLEIRYMIDNNLVIYKIDME